MNILRCTEEQIAHALTAIRVIKHEEDNIPLELITEDAMCQFLSDPNNYLVVAVENDEVLGYVVAYALQRVDREAKTLFFYEIGVSKQARKRGIGTALINFMKDVCETNNYMKMWVPTERSNNAAMQLYEKTGGTISESIDEVSFTWYPPYNV